MPRSIKDSDDEAEAKSGRIQTRLFTVHAVNSPLRRSSRIKQTKISPRSEESDSSISNSQPIRTTRQRTGTMDSVTSETLKKCARRASTSSDVNETIDMDVMQTPTRRTTRRSTTISTPIKITQTTNKRTTRAASEAKSPPVVRITRRTRSSSVDPESLFEQSKSQPGTPLRTRKRASMLPSGSPVKEVDERVYYVRLDTTIVENDERISSANSDSSPDKASRVQRQKSLERKSLTKDEQDNSSDQIASSPALSKSDEIHLLSQDKSEIYSKHINETTPVKKQKDVEEQRSSEESFLQDIAISPDETSVHDGSSSFSKYKKEYNDNIEMIKESPLKVEQSLIDVSKKLSTKDLGITTENYSDTFVEEQKRSPGNKENEILNIISETSTEKKIQPVANVVSLNKSPMTSPLTSLAKRRRSRESTETATKQNLSTDSVSPIIGSEKKSLDNSLMRDTRKKRSSTYNVDNELINLHDTNKSEDNVELILSEDNVELIGENIIEDQTNIENTLDVNKSDEADETEHIIIESEDSNKTELNEENEISCLPTNQTNAQQKNRRSSIVDLAEDNELNLVLEEDQDVNKVLSSPHSSDNLTYLPMHVATLLSPLKNSSEFIAAQDSTTNNDSMKQENMSEHVTKTIEESSNVAQEEINSESNNSDVTNAVIQDNQSSNEAKVSKKATTDISAQETGSKDVSFRSTLKRRSDVSEVEETCDVSDMEKETSKSDKNEKDQEDAETVHMDSEDDIGISLFKDIPADEWKKNRKDNVETRSIKLDDLSETECDLILVDKQAWLAAENMKAQKEEESFEYDSDDTVLLKSRLDAQASYANLDTIHEQALINFDDEEDETVKPIKKRKILSKKQNASQKNKDVSTGRVEDEESSPNKSKTFLNQSEDQSISTLNKSEQAAKAAEQTPRTDKEETEEDANELNTNSRVSRNKSLRKSRDRRKSLNKSEQAAKAAEQTSSTGNEETEKDANELNTSSRVSGNKSLRKSRDGRKSLNKSVNKDVPSNEDENNTQNISANKSRMDISEEEDNTDTLIGKKIQRKKRSLNKSRDNDTEANLSSKDNKEDTNASLNRSGKKSKSMNIEASNSDATDESNDGKIVPVSFKNYSMIAHAGTGSDSDVDSDKKQTPASPSSDDSSSESFLPSFLFAKADNYSTIAHTGTDSDLSDSDDRSNDDMDSDVRREYNLDGAKQQFSDDNVPDDECRASESEYSDSNDNGSDLKDFIVDDDEVENEREEDEVDDEVEDEEEEEIDDDIEDEKEGEKLSDEIEDEKKEEATDDKEDKESVKKNDENIGDKEMDIGSEDEQSGRKDEVAFTKKFLQLHEVKSSTPKPCKQEFKINETVELVEKISKIKDTKLDNTNRAVKNILLEKYKKDTLSKNNSLNESNRTSNKDKTLSSSLPSNLSEIMERAELAKSRFKMAKLYKTMDLADSDVSTIRFLRKEKLSESTPAIRLDAKTNLLKKKSLLDEEVKDITQVETNEKSNDAETSNLTSPPSGDAMQKRKKQKKKPRRQAEKTSSNNITDEDTIESMTKIELPKRSPIAKDNIDTDSDQKKKKKQISATEQNKNVNENNVVISTSVAEDNIDEELDQISKKQKKKKKKQIGVTDQDKNINENNISVPVAQEIKFAIRTPMPVAEDNIDEELDQISKKQKKKKKKQTGATDQDKNVNENNVVISTPVAEDNIDEELDQISKKQKKKKKQIGTTDQDKNINENNISEPVAQIKFAIRTPMPVAEDNIDEELDQISKKQKKKKKKQKDVTEQEKNINEDSMIISIPVENINEELNQISKGQKKKKKKQMKQIEVTEQDENKLQKDIGSKTELVQRKKKKNDKVVSFKQDLSTENYLVAKKKTKGQKTAESTETLPKKSTKDVAQIKIKKKKSENKVPNLIISSSDDAVQKSSRKKRQRETEKILNENNDDEIVSQDTVKSKRIKRAKYTQDTEEIKFATRSPMPVMEDDISEDVNQINEKQKRKKKKKQNKIDVTEQDTNLNEGNIPQKNIRGDKKRNVDNNSPLQTGVVVQKSKKSQPQNTVSNTNEPSTTFTKAWKEAREAIHAVQVRFKTDKELKQRKRRENDGSDTQRQDVKIPDKKQKKEVKEGKKPSSTEGLKRLPDDVIENLTDMPLKKKRKVSQNKEWNVPTGSKSKAADEPTVSSGDHVYRFPSAVGSTTQFSVVNLKKAKKQSSGAAAVASFRQRMLARNNREPVSAYLMYLEKERVKKKSRNEF